MGKKHAPSAYRSLVKESKSGTGRPPAQLAAAARALPDPYYASLALIAISLDGRLAPKEADKLAEESLALAARESRPWRKAELLVEICKKTQNTRFRTLVSLSVIPKIQKIEDGKARADAISGCVGPMGCEHAAGMLSLAAANVNFELESCKPVIKFMVESCKAPGAEIMSVLEKMPPSLAKAKLLGYLHMQVQRSGSEETEALEAAVHSALQLSGAERMESLKYLASQSSDLSSLETVAAAVIGLDSPLDVASLLATLAGSADKAGHKELALDWFRAGVECVGTDISDGAKGILGNLAVGLRRLGEVQQADELLERLGRKPDEVAEKNKTVGKGLGPATGPKPHSARHILALYDTHEGGLSQVHLRMVARAAPLCVAYGLDLGLMEFPETDIENIVKRVVADTNIGQGGRYLQELVGEKRVSVLNKDDWNLTGLAVATTSHPVKGKAISLEEAGRLAKKHSGKRLLVIMGLGRKGLPKSLLDAVDHHVELTGSNVPLETSTAMGIIAQQLGRLNKE